MQLLLLLYRLVAGLLHLSKRRLLTFLVGIVGSVHHRVKIVTKTRTAFVLLQKFGLCRLVSELLITALPQIFSLVDVGDIHETGL